MATSPLKSHLGFWMRIVSNHVSHSFARRVESSGATVAEWVILREMYGRKGITSPGTMAEVTGLTRGAVSKLVERLLKKGLITRTESANDRRFQEIRLTSPGSSLVPKLARLADTNDEEFFAVLSPAERKQLMEILKKLVNRNRLTGVPTE